MDDELKPCPFCAGECRIVKTSWGYCPQCQGRDDDGVWCHMHVLPLPSYNTPEEAAEAWNRRADRTCRMTFDGREYGYRCSRCGCITETYRDTDGKFYAPDYCSHCGARVVRD